jgi:O-antigen/teichoic acid export membrane protein
LSQRKSGAVLGYINIGLKNLVNLLYTPLLLHYLGQGNYGVFQMTNSVVFSLTILSMGFDGAYVRFYSRLRAKSDDCGVRRLNGIYFTLYGSIAVLALVIGGLFVANTQRIFSGGLTADEIALCKSLMVIMIINVAITFLSSPFDAFIMAHERFVFQQSRQIFLNICTPFLAIALLSIGMGAVGVAIAQLSVSAVLLMLNVRFAYFKLGMRFLFKEFDFGLLRAVGVFSFWIFLNQITDLVNNQIPNFLLGALAGASTVAVFAIASQMRNLFFSMSTILSSLFVPLINRIVAGGGSEQQLTKLMTKVGRYQMIIFWYIFGGYIILGRYFIHLWAGGQNADAFWLSIVMIAPVMVPLVQNTGIEIQRAQNQHKTRSIVYVITAVLNIVFSLVLIPRWGYWAPTIGYLLSMVIGPGLFMNWFYQARIGLDMFYFWRRQMPIILMSVTLTALFCVAVFFFPVTNLVAFVAWGLAYSVLFVGLAWKSVMNGEERGTVLQRIGKKERPRDSGSAGHSGH